MSAEQNHTYHTFSFIQGSLTCQPLRIAQGTAQTTRQDLPCVSSATIQQPTLSSLRNQEAKPIASCTLQLLLYLRIQETQAIIRYRV
jgi:hypothetical protein